MITRNTLYSVVLCALFSQVLCLGADYYVDAAGGNDSNAGTSTSAAWRTIAKVNARTFSPGDRILLRRGQVWREQLIVPSSGVSGRPITFGAYGSGNRPVLKGTALPTGWTSQSSTVWRGSLSAAPNQVFFSGVRGTKVGGVSSVNGARKWYWSGGVLYVYSTSNPGSTVEASVRPSTRSYGLLHVVGREHVNIESIEVTQSASFGLYIKAPSRYVTVRDCDVSHALDGGLVAPSSGGVGPTQLTVEDCLVHHNNGGFKEGAPGTATYHEGLTMENVDGFVIRRTKVYSNYMEGSNFKRGARNGLIEHCDLYANDLINQYIEGATNIEIRYNRIYDCSYNAGIEFGMETNTNHNDNVRIHHNVFWNNSGGVSFWAGSFTGQHRNIRIENNTFFGNWEAIRWKAGATDNYSGTNYIRNNLIWQNGSSNRAIWDYTSGSQAISRTTISHNAFQQGAATATTGSNARVISDPYFTNAGSRDFRLRTGSPCINTGANIGWTADLTGVSIPQGGTADIGAYEFGSGGTTTSYTLSVSGTNGAVTRTPNQTSYTAGQTVTLQATANSGYTFAGWSGALTGSTNPATVVMDSNKSITANFTANTATGYTLSVSGTNGTVTRTPNKTSYASGETVSLQATANSGYTFSGWSGALSGTANPASLVMNANKSVTANFTATNTGGGTTTKALGNATVFSSVATTFNRRAVPYTMPEAGQLQSVSIYHNGGSGQMILGVYSDSSGRPGTRLGATNATTVNGSAGWQTVALQGPVSAASGQKLWLAWLFQNGTGIRATGGTPGRAEINGAWSGGMPTTFGTSTVADYIYSIYANYTTGVAAPATYTLSTSATNGTVTKTPNKTSYTSGETVTLQVTPNSGYTFTDWSGSLTGTTNPASLVMNANKSVTANFAASGSGGSTTTKTVGDTRVLSSVTKEANRRAMPYTMSEAGQLQSISMYHQGGSGQMILAVYADNAGRPGTRLGVTNSTTVNGSAGWQTISLQSPAAVLAGQRVWLAWVFQTVPGIRYTRGTPGRADAGTGWSGGMPATFGGSTVANYIYSIYATYSTTPVSDDNPVATEAVGNTTVLPGVATALNRRAVPYTMPEAGELESISIYHNGGSGQMLLGVYSDSSSRPGTRLGVTNATAVNGSAGWQTVSLQNPVSMSAGQRLWLAWLLEKSVGVRATAGTPGRAEAGATWSGGMPTTFGDSRVGNYIYSIYATYRPASGVAASLQLASSEGLEAEDLSDVGLVEVDSSGTGPMAGNQVEAEKLSLSRGVCTNQTDLNQGRPATGAGTQGNTWVLWHAGDAGERQVYAANFFPVPGSPAKQFS